MIFTVGQLITALSKFKSELPVVVHGGCDNHLTIEELVREWFPDTDRVVIYSWDDFHGESPEMRTAHPSRKLKYSPVNDLIERKIRERENNDGT